MRIARSAAPYLLLVGAAVVATWPILSGKGLPYSVDLSGFFPLSPEAYEGRFWPLWNERGGMSTLQFLPALAFELPLLVLGRLLGFDMEAHLKVRVVLGFALAGASMYALARHYLSRRHPQLAEPILVLASLAAGLLYMLNPWSVHRVFHYFLWIGYGMAPLVVLAFERVVLSPTWRRGLALAAVAALATTDPHNPATFAILLAPLALLRFAPLLRRDRAGALRLAGPLGVAALAYLGLAAYWILPYAYNAVAVPGFGPSYVMSHQMMDILSRNGGFADAARLLHNYLPRADLAPSGGPALAGWMVASWAIPLLAFGAVALDRSRVAWTYAAIAAATLLLGMGSRGPLPGAYAWLLFGAPWGEGLSWLFRDPYRWGGMQALAYGVLLALSLAGAASTLSRVRVPQAAPALGLAVALLFVAPGVAAYASGPYSPVVVPSEYAEANAYLAAAPADASVVWMPRMLGATTWSGGRTVEYFDATSSARPSLGPFRPHTSTYFDFLKDAAKDGAPMAPLLARAGADRVLYHNDVNTQDGARVIRQLETLGLAATERFGDLPTLAVDQSSVAPPYTPAARYPLHGERVLDQSFVPRGDPLAILTLRADDVGSPGPLHVSILDASGREVFAANATMRSDEKEVSVPLRDLRLRASVPHTLRLEALAPSDAANAYNVSYYKVDAYPEGALAGTTGDLHFEFLARTRGFAVALVSPHPAPALRVERAVASPDGLQALRVLETLPQDGALRDAPIAFLESGSSARGAFASSAGPWSFVASLDVGELPTVVPFLPASSFLPPLAATTNADPKEGWARGTQDFAYYGMGWKVSLGALRQESWAFDGGDGLLFTSVPANATLPVPRVAEASVALARLHESPKGGWLSFRADASLVGRVDTRGEGGLRWVEVGRVPAGATSLVLSNEGGFQGVDAIAIATERELADARAGAAARMAATPVTLLAQAETVPSLSPRTIHLAGVGRVAEVATNASVRLDVPARGDYALWLRMPAASASPQISLDGAPLGMPQCAADCWTAARWHALDLGALAPGAHVVTLSASGGKAQIDVLAVSSDPGFAQAAGRDVEWTRVSATTYRATIEGPGLLALAVPYDAGWVARVEPGGHRVRSIPVDGVANGFLLPEGAQEVVLSYEPQAWAVAGASIAAVTAFAALGLVGAAAWARRSRDATPKEASR